MGMEILKYYFKIAILEIIACRGTLTPVRLYVN
jgi:hypothetical protein